MAHSTTWFRTLPQDIDNQPARLSSLQTFESALLCFGFGHSAAAATQWALALELLLRSAADTPADASLVQEVLPSVLADHPALAETAKQVKVTEILQQGYVPQTGPENLQRIFACLHPFYVECWQAVAGFDLQQALVPDLAEQLAFTARMLEEAQQRFPDSTEDPWIAASYLRRKLAFEVARGQLPEEVAQDWACTTEAGFDRTRENRQHLERKLDPVASYFCPVCEAAGMYIVQLDGEALDRGERSHGASQCANCDFGLPARWSFMADELLAQERELG